MGTRSVTALVRRFRGPDSLSYPGRSGGSGYSISTVMTSAYEILSALPLKVGGSPAGRGTE
jgi:hypothetical protein